MMPLAIAIALGYGLAALAIVHRGTLLEPWLLAAFAAGAALFPLTVFLAASIQSLAASTFRWGPDAVSMTLGAGLVGIVIAAAVNEVFKLAAALIARSWSRGSAGALAFGAAAGAGFAAVGAYQVIHLAVMARALPISSGGGFVLSLVQQMAFVAINTASTALAALGMARRRAGPYLITAVAAETLFAAFGLLYELQAYSIVAWTIFDLAASAALLTGALTLGRRRVGEAELASAA